MNHERKITNADRDSQPRPARRWWQIFLSVIAAAVGVQSHKNRERDFADFSPWPYIFAGLIFMAIFISLLIGIVHLVLP